MANVPTTEELTALFDQSLMADEMVHWATLSDPAEVQMIESRCVELHNSGTIDLLRLVESGALQGLETTDYFSAVDFFCRILPDLEAAPGRMMTCIEALVTRGGEDMVANQPNGAFRDWCKRDLRRAREVIVAARSGDELACRHLTFALEAINDVTEARQIALAYDDIRRLSAITAIGRMKDDDPTSQSETLATFGKLLDSGADDNLRANMLEATAAIIERNLRDNSLAVNLVRRLVEDATELTLHQSARMLWAHRGALKPEIIAALLEVLSHLNPANKETVKELDLGLQSLLRLGQDEAAIAFVTRLLSSQDQSLELQEFGGFTRALFSGPPERVSRVVVQWLMLGIPSLCNGLARAIRRRVDDMQGPPVDLRAEDLVVPPRAQVFICRKAIGWFFVQPITAASIVVSVLRICDEETAIQVQKLLVEILLMNYNIVRDYLKGLAPDDPARGRVNQSLAQHEEYLATLRAIPFIKELEPSERHRSIEQLRISEQMRDAHKQAEKKSILFNLVKHSVLLYGNRSLHFAKDDNDRLRPMEMDLKPIGISFEVPRMEIIDPVGLDYTLRVFRVERMAS